MIESETQTNQQSKRSIALKKAILDAEYSICAERAVIWTDYFNNTANQKKPVDIQIAEALARVLREKSITIYPDELIVGNFSSKRIGGSIYPELHGFPVLLDLFKFTTRKVNPLKVTKQERKQLLKTMPFWMFRFLGMKAFKGISEKVRFLLSQLKSTEYVINETGGIAHFAPDYEKLVNHGIKGILAEAKELQAQHEQGSEKWNFYESIKIINTAMIDFSDKRMQFSFSEPKIENNVIYHPHTFLKPPERNVVREKDPVSHIKNKDTKGNPLWSGKIRCSLTTRGPVFIPDTNNDDYFNMKEEYPDHKNYGFFRINNEPAIPGSSIRGMISSVYEALTNSCFRVMDQARYLTRSEKPDPDEEFLPGKIVRKNDGSLSILEMEEFLRLPLYDVEDNINKINEKDFSSINQQKLKAAMDCNKKIAEAAEHNRIFLENNFSSEEREEVLKGKAPVFFVKYSSHGENGYDKDWIAFLTLEKNKKGKKNEKAKKGYIKFTGPSMVNVDSDNEKEGRASQNKKYPRPVLKFKTDTHEYSVLKRCEHVFVKKTSEENIYALPENIRKQYNDLKKDNRDNTKTIPEVFRAWTPHEKLTEGDLVYFKHDTNNKIT